MRLARLVPGGMRPAARGAKKRWQRLRRSMIYGAQACPAILMYHRVAEPDIDFAVDTRADVVEPRDYDSFALPRIAVGDHGGEELCHRIAALGG